MTLASLIPLHKVFKIEHGNKLDLNKMVRATSGTDVVSFVGRSGEQNGISAFVEPLKDRTPYPAGFITVALGGATLSSFVQPRPFYTAQNVDVLSPLEEMPLEEKLYYCLCIEANKFRYSTFGREANRTLKNLPVPARTQVPGWIAGIMQKSVAELTQDLLAASAI